MRPFSVAHRAADVADVTGEVLDVLVVGAGATGAGVALDAASRGLTVAVVDRGDLASGTSSKSSKLIHGGLRYLENYDVLLVYEGVNERELLQRLAPHLVRPMEFVYPILPDTDRVRMVGLGLTTYDVLAGWRNVKRHDRISAEEAVAKAPALAPSDVLRAYVYGDCATDDARLVLANVVAARRFGATVLTYSEVVSLLTENGRVSGATVADRLTGETYDVRARHVVNATGVWVDTLLALEDPAHQGVVRPSKGVHLVVPNDRVPLTDAAILMPSRQGDGRNMFAIPWGRQTILGTTDTAYDGPLDAVSVEERDVEYVLGACNALFHSSLSAGDVVGAWAGCRPLLRGSSEAMSDLSRRHALSEGPTGLLTITGGKLTTYRRMAKDVVDRVVDRDGMKARCRTDEIPLGSSRPYDDVVAEVLGAAKAHGLGDEEVAATLVRQHGEAAADVLSLALETGLVAPLSGAACHLMAEVLYAARHEGAATLEDVFARRTRLALRARDAALPVALDAALVLAGETGRDVAWAKEQVAAYEAAVRRERGAIGL